MRALVQRVTSGRVSIGGVVNGEIGKGLVILLGVTHSDSAASAEYCAKRCANLRIFEDEAGKMNRSLLDIGGEALVVSQFTLYGDTVSSGRRPSFTAAARPEQAIPLYEQFIAELRAQGLHVETGRFGADMAVDIFNDGPVTLMVESREQN